MSKIGILGMSGSVAALIGLAGCNSQMVRTSEFTAGNFIKRDEDATRRQVRPILGVPYYMPKTMLRVSIVGAYVKQKDPDTQPDLNTYTITAKTVGVEQVADPSHVYLLEIQTENATNDEISIGVNESGLLETVTAISEDRSGDILKKLAETAAEIISSIPKGIPLVEPGRPEPCTEASLRPFSIEWLIPVDEYATGSRSVEALQAAIYMAMNGKSSIDPETDTDQVAVLFGATPSAETKFGGEAPAHLNPPQRSSPGIRFRLPRTASYEFAVDPSTYKCSFNSPYASIGGQRLLYMDPAHEYFFDMSRTPLVKKSVTLTVKNGVLVSAKVVEPSPALAAVSLPLDIIKILLSPITTLIHGPADSDSATSAGGTTGN